MPVKSKDLMLPPKRTSAEESSEESHWGAEKPAHPVGSPKGEATGPASLSEDGTNQ